MKTNKRILNELHIFIFLKVDYINVWIFLSLENSGIYFLICYKLIYKFTIKSVHLNDFIKNILIFIHKISHCVNSLIRLCICINDITYCISLLMKLAPLWFLNRYFPHRYYEFSHSFYVFLVFWTLSQFVRLPVTFLSTFCR